MKSIIDIKKNNRRNLKIDNPLTIDDDKDTICTKCLKNEPIINKSFCILCEPNENEAYIDICLRCLKNIPMINSSYCISCMQCEKCATILDIHDGECDHCRIYAQLLESKMRVEKPISNDFSLLAVIAPVPYFEHLYVTNYDIHIPERYDRNNNSYCCGSLLQILRRLRVPKVILRYIMMKFLDLRTIKNLLLIVKEMNVLDNYSKDLILAAARGFEWNCKKGNLDVAMWLYARRSSSNISFNLEKAFEVACGNDHLTVAKWLYSIGGVNIHADNEYAFRWACRSGHIDVAQWLYCISGVNIHADNEYAFRCACRSGHIDVAQWLYSIGGVNIHADNEHAFVSSSKNGHLVIAQWLFSLGNINIHYVTKKN